MKVFANEEILLHHSVLNFRIDLCFPKLRLTIEFKGKREKNRNEYKKVERETAIRTT